MVVVSANTSVLKVDPPVVSNSEVVTPNGVGRGLKTLLSLGLNTDEVEVVMTSEVIVPSDELVIELEPIVSAWDTNAGVDDVWANSVGDVMVGSTGVQSYITN